MRRSSLILLAVLAGAANAHAYVLAFNTNNLPLHWKLLTPDSTVSTNVVNTNTHAVRYFLASDGYSTNNATAELNLVRAAFAQWQSFPGTHLKFEDAGTVPHQTDVNTSDGTNMVFWTHTNQYFVNGGLTSIGSGTLGVTYTRFNTTENRLSGADIVFNGAAKTWFTDYFDSTNTNIYVEGVALHEIGHFIGLNHSPVGGATMLYHGLSGVEAQTGLSSDDVAAARFLYPLGATNYGAVNGTVTKDGGPVLGAAVFALDSATNTVVGTVTLTNGTYLIGSLPPGNYQIRVAPLDDATAGEWLVRGRDIASPTFTNADTAFLPTTNQSTTVTANATNTVDFVLTAGGPSFRIANIRAATANPGSYSWSSSPRSMRVGQSNYFIGVASSNLPTNGASLTITGDGLTLGAASFEPDFLGTGLNLISVAISISSNATPGLRDFIVQQGADIAYANGFLEIQPASLDYNFDGLDDAFQRTYFPLFTSSEAGPDADPDGDGLTNSGEYVAGTNPTNAASVLKILGITNTPSGVTATWQSVVGKKYQVSSRTNLTAGSWQNIGGVVTATNTAAQYFDPTATNGMGYYRVQVLP